VRLTEGDPVTEADWLSSSNPVAMIGFLQSRGLGEPRSCRLFACACVRRVWHLLERPGWREAVGEAERFADSVAGVEALADALASMSPCGEREPGTQARLACWYAAFDCTAASRLNPHYNAGSPYDWATASRASFHAMGAAVKQAARDAQRAGRRAGPDMRRVRDAETQAQAALFRDLFRTLPPVEEAVQAWGDGVVTRLAKAAYDERLLPSGHLDPARLAVLADALLDAGCSADAELLLHLRSEGPHVRGCWAVDAVVGRA
jgi:hypothetical protein